MTERLRAVACGFAYPVGESAAIVKAAGGFSKLTEAQRAGLTIKRVAVGEDCSDMDPASAAVFLARGWIEIVPGADAAPLTKSEG